jgi:mycothiol synthase
VAQDDEGGIAAYAIIRTRGTMVAVHPDREGEGWGAQILAWAERRAVERGADHHRQWIGSGNNRARTLLEAAGYRHVRSYWRMGRALDAPVADATVPEGIQLRPMDASADAESIYQVDVDAFSPAPDYADVDLATFREEHLDVHDFDAAASLVAERDGGMVGFLLARRWAGEGAGYVDILAVAPQEHGKGIGTTLLLTAFRRFADAGVAEAFLGVASDNPRALHLYERAGMEQRFRVDTYERPV